MLPKNLAEMQKSLAKTITEGEFSLDEWSETIEAGQSIQELSQRLTLYHNDYRFRLINFLRAAFKRTKRSLGDIYFKQMCDKYLKTQPPVFFIMGEYALNFPAFLSKSLEKGQINVYEMAMIDLLEYQVEVVANKSKLNSESDLTFEVEQSAYPNTKLKLNSTAQLFLSQKFLYVSLMNDHGLRTLKENRKFHSVLKLLYHPQTMDDVANEISNKKLTTSQIESFFKRMVSAQVIEII